MGTDFPFLSRFSKLLRDFNRYSSLFCRLFRITESYVENIHFSSIIRDTFLAKCHEVIGFEMVLTTFITRFKEYQSAWRSRESESDFIDTAQLIHHLFPDQLPLLLEEVCRFVAASTLLFQEQSQGESARVYVQNLNDFLCFQKRIASTIFNDQDFVSQLCRVAYDGSVKGSELEIYFMEVTSSCSRRDSEYVESLDRLLTFCEPDDQILEKFSAAIKASLDTEETSLEKLIESVSWYVQLVRDRIKCPIFQPFQAAIIGFVNRDRKALFKDLLHFIGKQATADGDLSPIALILLYLPNKIEFDLLYIRQAVRRLIPPSRKQVQIERKFMDFVKQVSDSFELRGLPDICHEADISMDLQIGPVLVLQGALWPFKNRHPLPVALSKYCSIITERYSPLFPTRLLSFPIEDWAVHVRETSTKVVFVASGVQAEILLFLNDHATVVDESLEPQIATSFTSSALKSLSTNRSPILKNNQGRYAVNRDFKRYAQQIILPKPLAIEIVDSRQTLGVMRDEAADAHIMRILKGRRMMPVGELAAELRQAVADLFPIDHQEIRQRMNILASRDFIEILEDGNVVYVP